MLERRVLVHYFLTVCFFTLHGIFSSSDVAASSHGAIPQRPHYHPLYEDPDNWTPLVSAMSCVFFFCALNISCMSPIFQLSYIVHTTYYIESVYPVMPHIRFISNAAGDIDVQSNNAVDF
jgi:hypothetical protein